MRYSEDELEQELDSAHKELDYVTRKVNTLFDAIKHGDEAHQAWLKDAIDSHFEGRPIPLQDKPK